MHKDVNYYELSKALNGGIVSILNDEVMDYLRYIKSCCNILQTDTKTDAIFKDFVNYGNLMQLNKKYGIREVKPSDILFFKQSTNVDLTIIAKLMYYNTNKNMEFLKKQADILITKGCIDICSEYIKYFSKNYSDSELEYKIPEWKNLFEEYNAFN